MVSHPLKILFSARKPPPPPPPESSAGPSIFPDSSTESASTGIELPREIADEIIDQLCTLNDADRKKSLGICSLVCRYWLQRSRRHLFERIYIPSGDSSRKRFLRLLDKPLCTFKPQLRHLSLDEGRTRRSRWLSSNLPRLSTLLAVRRLDIDTAQLIAPQLPGFLPQFQDLQVLRLWIRNKEGQIIHVLKALSLCTSLKSVCLWFPDVYDHDAADAADFPPPPSLKYACVHPDILEWLISGQKVNIETVSISYMTAKIATLTRCLWKLGPSLKTLKLRFSSAMHDYEEVLRDLDLRHNTKLSTIYLHGLHIDVWKLDGLVPPLLTQITSSKVRQVTLGLGSPSRATLDEVDWTNTAAILEQPKFSKLEKFKLIADTAYDAEEAEERLIEKLPPGRARDTLECLPHTRRKTRTGHSCLGYTVTMRCAHMKTG